MKNKILKFISNNVLFISYIVITILLEITLRACTIKTFITFKEILSDLAIVLFIGSFGYFIKPRKRYNYYLGWIIFFTLLIIGDTIYFEFYQSFLSVNLIATASMIGEVNDSLFAKIHLHQFIYIIYPIIYLYINYLLKKNEYYDRLEKDEEGKTVKTLFISIICITIILSFLSMRDITKFQKQWKRNYIVQKYGLYIYTINDLIQSTQPIINNSYGYDENALSYRNYYSCKWDKRTSKNDYTDIYKDKNVIFIHMESIQNFLIDLKVNDKEVTPNLNKLIKESMYFSNFYPQISIGTSSDTEFTLQTGLLPSSSGTVFINYYDRYYPSMVSYFKKKGYYTFSMHGNEASYWNREVMHRNFGYNDFFASEQLVINDENTLGLGISDKSFYEQIIPLLKDIESKYDKYYGTIITLSNHSPFGELTKYGEFDTNFEYSNENETGTVEYLKDTQVENYLKSSHYADEALGEFINKIKEENILNNTIFIFYGDHEARLSQDDLELLFNYDNTTGKIKDDEDPTYISMENNNYEMIKNTPLIIWDPTNETHTKVTKIVGMYDLLPTIANMFDFKEKYSLGHDLFSDNEGIVVFPNGDVLTSKIYYNAANEDYVTTSSEPINSEYVESIKEYSDTILDVSNGIIKYDLIKNEKTKVGQCHK